MRKKCCDGTGTVVGPDNEPQDCPHGCEPQPPTTQKHTPGPWAIDPTNDIGPHHIGNDDGPIADCNADFLNATDWADECNAKRIVECVNACEGIDDPTQLREQRDALLEALREISTICQAEANEWPYIVGQCQWIADHHIMRGEGRSDA